MPQRRPPHPAPHAELEHDVFSADEREERVIGRRGFRSEAQMRAPAPPWTPVQSPSRWGGPGRSPSVARRPIAELIWSISHSARRQRSGRPRNGARSRTVERRPQRALEKGCTTAEELQQSRATTAHKMLMMMMMYASSVCEPMTRCTSKISRT